MSVEWLLWVWVDLRVGIGPGVGLRVCVDVGRKVVVLMFVGRCVVVGEKNCVMSALLAIPVSHCRQVEFRRDINLSPVLQVGLGEGFSAAWCIRGIRQFVPR